MLIAIGFLYVYTTHVLPQPVHADIKNMPVELLRLPNTPAADRILVGAAPINWRNDDNPEWGKQFTSNLILSQASAAGYAGIEKGSQFPTEAEELREALAAHNLILPAAWESVHFTTKPFAEVRASVEKSADFLLRAGASVINLSEQGHSVQGDMGVPVFEGKPNFTSDQWMRLTEGVSEMSFILQQMGLTAVFHPHLGTGVQTAEEIQRLMEGTKDSSLALLYDTGHIAASGDDPQVVLERHHERIGHVHLKNVRPDVLQRVRANKDSFLEAVKAGLFTVPGDTEGMVDFEPILRRLVDIGYTGWFIVEAEQYPENVEPMHFARMGRQYIYEQIAA